MRRRTHRESERPLTFHEFLSILWRRKVTILVCMIVAVVAAFAYARLKTPTYQSSALVQLDTTNPATGQNASPVTFPDPVQLLGSTAVEAGAARLLHEADVNAVTSSVNGTVDQTSGALTITGSGSDPARAQAVAKAYTTAFLDQINAIVQNQINKINSQMDSVSTQIQLLESQPGAASNPGVQAQITGLSTTLGALQSQLSSIKVGEPYANVQVAPSLPTAPTGLSKAKILGIGVLAGLLVGCGAALVREQFDTRLRTTPDVVEVSHAPVLAELPQDGDVRTGKVSIALVQAPQSRMAESIRELRTSLRVVLEDAPCPSLMVTSPEAGDGKTFVAANLAAAWALSGSKVIVVSADFRRPRLEEVFGLRATGLPGLADAIKANWKKPEAEGRHGPGAPGVPVVSAVPEMRAEAAMHGAQGAEGAVRTGLRTAPADDRPADAEPGPDAVRTPVDESSVGAYLLETGIWGLSLLPAGTQLENPSELFGSPGMQPVLAQLPLLADIVLFDSPPVLAAPDAAILGGQTFGAVVVASEGKTDRPDLERTLHRLESTNCRVFGVAVNRTRKPWTDTYQYYTYKQQ